MEELLISTNDLLENILVIALLGTGLWLTFRMGFIQFRKFKHGIEVVSGKHDDPNSTGDVSHFQALTTALSATVGIGNTAGVAGTGAGVFIQTLLWGVRRGLFSNEAGQGSAPIAHSAAKTDEPVAEGVVALLEPFIDTLMICGITALVILTTGVWNQTTPTDIVLSSGDLIIVEK